MTKASAIIYKKKKKKERKNYTALPVFPFSSRRANMRLLITCSSVSDVTFFTVLCCAFFSTFYVFCIFFYLLSFIIAIFFICVICSLLFKP